MLTTLLLLALATWACRHVLARALGSAPGTEISAAAWCLAPTATAWIVAWLIRLTPGQSGAVYLAATAAIWLSAGLASRRQTHAPQAPAVAWPGLAAIAAAAALAGMVLALTLVVPLYSNDPMEYAAVAQSIVELRSLAHYPMAAAVGHGLYAPWTHPPGYPVLIALPALAGVDIVVAAKLMSGWHAVALVLAMFMLAGARLGAWVVALLLGMPILAVAFVNAYVDAVRVCTLAGGLALVLAGLQAPTWRLGLALGAGTGLSHFVHSLGMLTPVMLVPAMVWLRGRGWRESAALVFVALGAHAAVIAPDLAANLRTFGVLMGDSPPVWRLPGLGRDVYVRAWRGLEDGRALVFQGALQGLTNPQSFGLSFWLALPALGVLLRRIVRADRATALRDRAEPAVLICGAAAGSYMAMVLASLLIGSVEAVKNPRYLLTVQPFLALLTVHVLASLPSASPAMRRGLWIAGGLALAASALVPAVYLALRWPPDHGLTQSLRQRYLASQEGPALAVGAWAREGRPGDCVLTLEQAGHALYGERCFMSFLDTRMLAVYRAADGAEAAHALRRLGITHIDLPGYAMPELYNTPLGRLAGDPGLVELAWSAAGRTMLRLRSPASPPAAVVAKAPAKVHGDNLIIAPVIGNAGGREVDRLCVSATGRGRVEVGKWMSGSSWRRLASGRQDGALGFHVDGNTRQCVLVAADDLATQGRWQVTTSGNARIVDADLTRHRLTNEREP